MSNAIVEVALAFVIPTITRSVPLPKRSRSNCKGVVIGTLIVIGIKDKRCWSSN